MRHHQRTDFLNRSNHFGLLLFLTILVYLSFLCSVSSSACGPVHEWVQLSTDETGRFTERAGYDIAFGLLDALRVVLGERDEPFGLAITVVEDCTDDLLDPSAVKKLSAAFSTAAGEAPDFRFISVDRLEKYLVDHSMPRSRLINPTISSRVARDLDFNALVWLKIMSYGATESRNRDVLEQEMNVFADFVSEETVVRVKVVDARSASILWIDELYGEFTFQSLFLVHQDPALWGTTVEVTAEDSVPVDYQASSRITSGITVETDHAISAQPSAGASVAAPTGATVEVDIKPLSPEFIELVVGLPVDPHTAFTVDEEAGITIEMVEATESYQNAYPGNKYWRPHDEETH